MQALKCELCGGNNLTKKDGVFVCDYCGTKYTLEEARKLMINGPVEVVTGNAEKERLLENANQFYQIGEKGKSREVYYKVTQEFPGEYRGWLGLMKHKLDEMPVSLSKDDIQEIIKLEKWPVYPDTDNYGVYVGKVYEEIVKYSGIALKLDQAASELIDQLWLTHDNAHNQWIESINEKYAKDEEFFLDIWTFLGVDYYVPQKLRPLLIEIEKSAKALSSFLYPNYQYKFENIEKIASGIYKFEKYTSDGYSGYTGERPNVVGLTGSYHPFRYLTKREAVADNLIIVFDNSYTIEAIKSVLMTNTKAEQGRIWADSGKCELCGTALDDYNVCPKCSHVNANMIQTVGQSVVKSCNRFRDRVNLEYELKKMFESYASRYHNDGLVFESFTVGPNSFELGYSYQLTSTSRSRRTIRIPHNRVRELVVFLSQRQTNNICQWCGNQFTGLITKKCVKCGRTKDF